MAYTYLLPKDTQALAERHTSACKNFGLLLGRYVPREAIFETDRLNDRGRSIGKERNFWIQDICKKFAPDAELIAKTYQRWQAMTEGAARFSMVSRSRMIVGLGGKGSLEFGLTLHPVTGLPYIPGSALKGLCRNYALLMIAERWQVKVETEALKQLDEALSDASSKVAIHEPNLAKLYRNLFGTQSDAGQCIFYDAVIREFPPNIPLFAVEVMTPHFRKYYESGGKEPPHDADDPNPITYIAVNANLVFRFAVGLRRTASVSGEDEDVLGDAQTLLMEALQLMGIGAKTAAGYGVFAPLKAK